MRDSLLKSLANFSDPFSVWQMAGWCAVPFYLLSYQIRSPKNTIKMHIPGDLFYVVHYYGLGVPVQAWISVASALRNVFGALASDRYLKLGLVVYVAFIWACSFYLSVLPVDYLPAVGSSIRALSINFREFFWRYRLCNLLFQITYIVVFISIGSYSGLFLVTLTTSSNLIGMWRFARNDKKV